MTPEVEELLRAIGWDTVKRVSPGYARQLALNLTPTGGRIGETRKNSKAAAEMLEMILQSAFDLQRHLGELPKNLSQEIVLAGRALDGLEAKREGQDGWPLQSTENIDEAIGAIGRLMAGVEAVLSRAETEAGIADGGRAPRGRARNAAAYAIAKTIVRIFVIGTGRLPGIGRREDGQGASGDYGRAVEAVFKELGLRVGDAFPPCKHAVDSLGEEEKQALLFLRCPLTRSLVEVRMEKHSPVV